MLCNETEVAHLVLSKKSESSGRFLSKADEVGRHNLLQEKEKRFSSHLHKCAIFL